MSKSTKDIELLCQRCGHYAHSLKEYVLHKRDMHHVRIKDTVESLRILGMEDPVFEVLLKNHPDEKVSPEYIREARKALADHMKQFTK